MTRLPRLAVHPVAQVLKHLSFFSSHKRGGGNDAISAPSSNIPGPRRFSTWALSSCTSGRWEFLVLRALRHVPEVRVLKHLSFPSPHKRGNGNDATFAALSTSQGLGAEAPRPYLSAHAGIGPLRAFEGFITLQSSQGLQHVCHPPGS